MVSFKVHLVRGAILEYLSDKSTGGQMGKVSILTSALFNAFYQWFNGNILLLTTFGSGMKIGGIYNVISTRQCGLLSDLGLCSW